MHHSLAVNHYKFRVSYSVISIQRLAYPYKTNCQNYETSDQQTCQQTCLNDGTQRRFGKISFSTITKLPLDLKHVSPWDVDNETFRHQFNALAISCDATCKKDNCFDTITSTKVTAFESRICSYFQVNYPTDSYFRIRFLARITFTEYLVYRVYILSCLGIWFGVSIINLNPFSMFSRRRRRESHVTCRSRLEATNRRVANLEQQWRLLFPYDNLHST